MQYMGVNEEPMTTPVDAPDQVDPWYKRPVPFILDMLGNVRWVGEDYMVETKGGALTIDTSGAPPPPPPAPAIIPGLPTTGVLGKVPTWLWVGGAAVVGLALLRR